MECCPHLYCTDTSSTPVRQTDEHTDGAAESTEGSSDVEDLDDMRHGMYISSYTCLCPKNTVYS